MTDKLVRWAATASLGTAIVLTLLKLGAAVLTGSVALLSLLIDGLADIAASAVTFLAIRVAQTPPDILHRFGHGKAEALSALAQGALVAGSGLFVLVEAGRSLLGGQMVAAESIGILVTSISLVSTTALVLFQRHVIARTGSTAIAADRLHYTTDLAANLFVLASLLAGSRLPWLDPVVGAAIAAFMVQGAVAIARRALHQLMDRELPDADRRRIEALVMADPAVEGIHDLRTRRAAGVAFMEFHIEIDGQMSVLAAHEVTDRLEQGLDALFPGAEIIIHQEPAGLDDARLDHRIESAA